MASRPLSSKCPTTACTPLDAAHFGKSETGWLVTVKLPSPLENANGTVLQPGPPTRAMLVRPSPAKSPRRARTPALADQPGKLSTVLLVTSNVPSGGVCDGNGGKRKYDHVGLRAARCALPCLPDTL